MIKETATNLESLPDELLFNILVRLPADSLHQRARLVCHRWFHIIRSDGFINTHFRQHSTYGLALSTPIAHYMPHSIYVTATQQGLTNYKFMCTTMLACCNGLVLQSFRSPLSLRLRNPATKKSFLLPSVSRIHVYYDYKHCGFAYSPASMEYKVALPYYDYCCDSTCLDILTVGVDKSWRHVEIPPLLESFRSLLFDSSPLSSEGGFLHWGKEVYCLTLNLETEILTMSEVPLSIDHSYYYLSTGTYLSVLVRRGKYLWEVWEMKPAASSEWRKSVLPDIDLEPQKRHLRKKYELLPIFWVKYPEVLAFRYSGFVKRCIVWNLETHKINDILLGYPCRDYKAFAHTNSLLWLNQ